MKSPKKDKRTELEKLVDAQIGELAVMENSDPDYQTKFEECQKNIKLLTIQRELKPKKEKKEGINWTPIIVAGIGFIEIIAIMNHERMHVITTKALSMIAKGRV